MGTYRAVGVACETVVRLLEASYDPDLLDGTSLQFDLYRSKDFKTPMESGLSLYVYRIAPNGVLRSPPSTRGDGSRTHRPRMALDVHVLLTAWARKASLELSMLGWAMRVLEDRAVVPASLLNSVSADTFDDAETLEVVPGDLPVEDMMRIWDGLPSDYQTSVPYTVRLVAIESLLPPRDRPPTEERQLRSRLR